jgi:hypothetical protein
MNVGVLALVKEIQKDRPGWRFSLLGGDFSYDYIRTKCGEIKGVSKKKPLVEFGWQAEFFGDIDPSKNTGERHVSSGLYRDPGDAIVIACAMARKLINQGAKK